MAEPDSSSDGLWRHYWATWRTMFAIQSTALILGLSIAIPILSLATSRAIARSGDSTLSDTDLLEFLFGPNLPFIAIAVLALGTIIHVFGYAAQLFAAHASFHGAPVSVFTAIHKTGRLFLQITLLSSRFFLQLFITALPFLLVIVGVLSLQLREHDFYEYLEDRPPEFLFAIAFALLVFGVMIIALAKAAVRWVHAMPLVLFHSEKPSVARRMSRKKSRPIRRPSFLTFALWSIGTPLLVFILNAASLPLALQTAELLGHRLGLLALSLSVITLTSVAIAVVVGFISLTFLALQHVRLYRRVGLDSDDPPATPDPLFARPIRYLLSVGLIAAGLLTIGLSYRWLDGLRIVDHALVIAHRGASATLPENTVIAVVRAFERGSHGIAVDVRQRAEREILVFADPDFSRLAGNPLKLDDATDQDLATIDIGSWKDPRYHEERVPTLDQIIALCSDRSALMLYLPDLEDENECQAFFTRVSEQIEASPMQGRTWFVCARPEQVEKFHSLYPESKVGFQSQTMIDGPLGAPASFVIVPASSLRADLISNLRSQKVEVFASGSTDPVMMSAVLSRGADGLVIPAPGVGRKVIEERTALNPVERLLIEFIARIRDALPPSPPHHKASQ